MEDKKIDNIDTVKKKTSEISVATKMIEAQYQTVNVKRIREQQIISSVGIEEILSKIDPPKSFLYRNHQKINLDKPVTLYVPMDAGTPKKPKKFFRLSSYEYPHFDLNKFRFSKTESHSQVNYNDTGYYTIKTDNKCIVQKTNPQPEWKKHKSLATPEEFNEKFIDDHLYEDLNYDNNEDTNTTKEYQTVIEKNEKPYTAKIQQLFHTIKLPFIKKIDEPDGVERDKADDNNEKLVKSECEGHIYENTDAGNIYDSVQVRNKVDDSHKSATTIPVEDYLEPVNVSRDYCDVADRSDDSLLRTIMSIIETRWRRREATDAPNSEDSIENDFDKKTHEDTKTLDKERTKTNMADRPLPVPVENESYYMDIDRSEAENLLRGTPDGTFVLRPSSQPNHAYTLTVSCSNAVHNVGVRRRPDGHLALGYARRGERSFANVASLLRHHRKRRLLLVVGGNVFGATTLNDTPQYYQTPKSLPVVATRANK